VKPTMSELSQRLSPEELVKMLNTIFTAFDDLAEGLRLEKIKTIGDAYMAASGVPVPRADHTDAIAELALAMGPELDRVAADTRLHLQLRIGIDTGPVVAGVIGRAKFIYDLWGDTVNTASRMESQGLAGRIQVTQRLYERLLNKYQFEKRGSIQVKGKGEMTAYLLNGYQQVDKPTPA